MSQRTERIDELLRQEIGTILSTEAKDPRIGFATVTEVETAPDLRHARVEERGHVVSAAGAKDQRALAVAARENGTPLNSTGVGWEYLVADLLTTKKIESSLEMRTVRSTASSRIT